MLNFFRIEIIRAVKREEQNLSTVGVGLGGTSGSSSGAGPSPSTQSLLSYDRKTDPKLIDTKRKEILQKKNPHPFIIYCLKLTTVPISKHFLLNLVLRRM